MLLVYRDDQKKTLKNIFIFWFFESFIYHILIIPTSLSHLLPDLPNLSTLHVSSLLVSFIIFAVQLLPKCSWLWGHPMEHGQTPMDYTLNENWLSHSQQISPVSIFSDGVELLAHFPFPCWDSLWFVLEQVLCNVSQSLWVHASNCSVVSGTYSFT